MFNPAYHTLTVRGCVLGDGHPKICIPLVASSMEDLEAQLEKLQTVHYDLAEYRADYFLSGAGERPRRQIREEIAALEADAPEGAVQELAAGEIVLEEHRKRTPGVEELARALELVRERIGQKPLIFTIRTDSEGGQAHLSYQEYAQWNLRAARTGLADLIDVEYFTAGEEAVLLTERLHQAGVKVIGSSHDFEKTPDKGEMLERLTAMQEAGMDISKLAVTPKTDSDVCRLLGVTVAMKEQYADRPFITMSMGKKGVLSRVSGAFTGSAVTFGSTGKGSAPGQMDASDLLKVLQILQA